MITCKGLAAALMAFAAGCGGTTETSPSPGDSSVSSRSGGSSGSSPSSGSSGSGGGSMTSGSSSGGSGPSGGSVQNEGGGLDAGDDGDAASAEIPDAFPASCGPSEFQLVDARTNPCSFTLADVSCDANAECAAYTVVSCGCSDAVWGVNMASMARCPPPPCAPPMQDCPADASGNYTQQCELVPFGTSFAAACVNHRCLSYATGSR